MNQTQEKTRTNMEKKARRTILTMALALAFCATAQAATKTATVDGVLWRYKVSGGAATVVQDILGGYSGDVTIPAKLGGYPVKEIGEATFACCHDLVSVTIPASVTTIGDYAFYSSELRSVTIPRNVTKIGNGAFEYCYSLASVTIAGNVKTIGTAAFYPCTNLSEFVISGSVESIGMSAFRECHKLTSLDFLTKVKRIGQWAFRFCEGLENLVIPDNVTSLGDEAFDGCPQLASVTIGAGVTSMGSGVFSDCGSLQDIHVAADNTKFAAEGGVLFSKDKRVLVQFPCGRAGKYAVPASVRSIGAGAFKECRYLTEAEMGTSVTNIGGDAFALSGIQSVALPPALKTIGTGAFDATRLTSVEIPQSVETIGAYAFQGSDLTAVNIPDGVKRMGSDTFANCESLTAAHIGSGVVNLPNYVFNGCTNLATVTYGNGVTNIGAFAFNWCSSLTEAPIGPRVRSLGEAAFRACQGLTEVTIPAGVTTIGGGSYGAFEACPNLKNIFVAAGNKKFASESGILLSKNKGTLIQYPAGKLGHCLVPDCVTNIANSAFSDCIALTSVACPNVATIGAYAFYNCKGLTYAWLSDNLKSVGKEAFYGCNWLTQLYVSGFWAGTTKTNILKTAWVPQGCEIIYREIRQRVKFNANGGECGTLAASYTAGQTYENLPDAFWAGRAFLGWWSAKSGGTRIIEGTTVVNKATNRTLHAHWTRTQTVSFDGNGGKCKTKTKACTIGKKYGTLPVPTLAGHGFTAWTEAPDGGAVVTAADVVPAEAKRTLYAQWTTTQTVTFDPNGGECGTEGGKFAIGAVYGNLPLATRAGWAFGGWYTAKKDGKKVTSASVATDAATRTLYAHWTKTQVLTYDANGGKCKTKSKNCTVGKTYGMLATATLAGHGFIGWAGAPEGGNAVTAASVVTETAARTVYAQWTANQTVTFDPNGGECGTAVGKFAIGAAYGQLPPATKAGQAFNGWWTAKKEGKKVTAASVVTEAAVRTLYAHWTTKQTVSFDANGGKCSTKTKSCTIGKAYGTLPSATKAGNSFDGWFTELVGGEQVTKADLATVEAKRTLYAHWTPKARALGTIAGIAVTARAGGVQARGMSESGTSMCVLVVETEAGVEYALQWTPELGGEWTTVKRWTADEDGECEVEVPVKTGTGFYRLTSGKEDNPGVGREAGGAGVRRMVDDCGDEDN